MEQRNLLPSLASAIIAMAVVGVLAIPAHADDFDAVASASEYYRANVVGRESGVYEHDGSVFIHAKFQFERSKPSTRHKAKLDATLLAGKMLRDWALKVTDASGPARKDVPPSLLFAKSVLDAYDPYWQFRDLKWSGGCRTLKDNSEGNCYIVGLFAERQELLKSIPLELKNPYSPTRLEAVLPAASASMLSGSRRAPFLKMCGAVDFIDGEADGAEFARVNAAIGKYLATSPFAKSLRVEAEEMAVPNVTTNISLEMNDSMTQRIEKREVITVTRFPRMQNLFLRYATETNFPTARLASGAEALGLARNAKATPDEKIKALKCALCESPGDKELWNYLGLIMMNDKDFPGAIVCFRNALKLDPVYGYPIVNLAKAYDALGAKRMAWGTAIVALGTSSDSWCRTESHKLLGLDASTSLPDSKPESKAVDASAPVSTSTLKRDDAGAARSDSGKQNAKNFAFDEVDTDLEF